MTILQTASNQNQKFALVQDDFGADAGKYAIQYAVGTSRQDYVQATSNQIKTWKTTVGATKAWLSFLKDHNAVND